MGGPCPRRAVGGPGPRERFVGELSQIAIALLAELAAVGGETAGRLDDCGESAVPVERLRVLPLRRVRAGGLAGESLAERRPGVLQAYARRSPKVTVSGGAVLSEGHHRS